MPSGRKGGDDRVVKVSDLMTREVLTAAPETSVREVARLLVEHRISGLPVVGPDDRVVGVVSETDIVQKEAGAPPARGGLLHWLDAESGEIRAKLGAETAGEAMTAPAVTIEAGETVTAAASLMLARGCKRLPVVDGGRLVGLVSRSDLVRAFVRADADIEREIRDGVGLDVFAVPPEELTVESHEGTVTLGGQVDNTQVAVLLAEFAARVPGVVAVRSHLTARS